MNEAVNVKVVEKPAVRVIGQSVRTNFQKASADCGRLFGAFSGRMGEIVSSGKGESYGVSWMVEGSETEFDYWAALPVAEGAVVPSGMKACVVPAGLYAECPFGSFGEISRAYQKIFMEWLPRQSAYALREDAPSFEYYPADAKKSGLGIVYMPLVKR